MAFPVTDDRINAAETALGRKFAPDHRARLLQDNGGEIEAIGEVWQLFPVWDAGDRRRMKRTANHVVKENDSAEEWYGFPEDALAIAAYGSGNYLIYRGDSDAPEFWDHDTGETEPAAIDWQMRDSR